MTRSARTKLFKAVIKQARLMRAPFRRCSSSKLPFSVISKNGEKFRAKLIQLSVSTRWADVEQVRVKSLIKLKETCLCLYIRKEWIVFKHVQISKRREQCLCGKGNLKFVTYLKNIRNNREVASGNCCLLTLKRSLP